MMEPYARATLFLTYIQGGNMTEWVDQLGDWLEYQIDPRNPHHTTVNNEWLWNSVELAFNRQYTCNGLAPFVRLGPLRTLKST